jgi:Glyoxalase-like domain
MNKLRIVAVLISFLTLAAVPTLAQAGIALDHVWIMVTPNAPERAALERAGFEIAKEVNHHEGTGTSSITVEFDNSYLELMWPDDAVPVSHGLERAAEKYRQRMAWRTSGWCPFGISLRRTTSTDQPLPFPTWSWTAEWMKGSRMEMLTPRDDKQSPALFIEPRAFTDEKHQAARGAQYHHAIGAHRITGVKLISPKAYRPIEAATYLQSQHIVSVETGDQWVMELTLDDGPQKKSKDLRPDLPLVVRH